MNIEHTDFKPLILTAVQNVVGLAIAGYHHVRDAYQLRNLDDVKSKFFTSLGDYLYNSSKMLGTTSESELHVFLNIWNHIFTKIHHGKIFHCDNYKYDPTSQLLGGNL